MTSGTVRSPTFAYVGCFGPDKRDGHGKGISVYRIESSTGAWKLVEIVDTLPSPGFLVLDREGRFLYAGHATTPEVSAYAIDRATGKLKLLNRQPTGGDNGLHLNVHPNNRYLALAHDPGIDIFPINPDGSLGACVDSHRMDGADHHMVLFDAAGRYLLAPDHGNHKIHVLPFDARSGKLTENPHFTVDRPGAGPRHLAFHPAKPWIYDVNRNSTVTGYHWDAHRGQLKPFQVIRTVPDSHTDENFASEVAIAPAGKFVYVSNRPHDTIATFAVDQNTGMLKAIAWDSIQGRFPRFFTLDEGGNFLYVGAVQSHRIVIFKINGDTGQLTPTGQIIETPSPTCIALTYH